MASNSECSSSYSDDESMSNHSTDASLRFIDLDVLQDEDPLATEEEQAAYAREIECEVVEETELSQRFHSETVASAWYVLIVVLRIEMHNIIVYYFCEF